MLSFGGKWLGLVTAIWVQAVCGNNYTFANYSHVLKSLMSLTQMQLNNLSVAKDFGKAFGLLSGLASHHFSTSLLLIIGATMGFIGYGLQFLVVTQTITPLPYWLMCIFLCMGGNSTTWMNTAVLVTCMRNFPNNRGPISGILKGYVGLSTAIFTDICSALFSSDPSMFLLMLTIFPAIICCIAAVFLRETPPASTCAQENKEAQFLNTFNLIAVTVAVYLLAFDVSGIHGHVLSLIFTAGLLILLLMPLLVPLYLIIFNDNPSPGPDQEQQIHEALLDGDKKVEEVETTKGKAVIGEEHSIGEMMRSIEFWIMFMSFLCGVGTGMCVMNNMGQMGEALGYSDVSIFISFTSIWGFFGRIVSGSLSEHYIRKSGTPRVVWNAGAQILMSIGYIALAMAVPGSLYIGSMVVGICYGVYFTITPAAASELFGLKYYGIVYNILILNLPIGSFIFSGLIAGYLYDVEATTSVGGEGNSCIGAHCYRLVYVIMAFASLLGCVLDLLLAVRTRKVYYMIYQHRTTLSNSIK
ncbi:hypothetical protein PIB30_054117 [Stylosanthes scabra]|uniref:Nodulin-like domain-containing protein n=1 Tax=Stylosanthes scabra TaxID=79078 RepID=A0ABU6UK81_9FABA|nr:hypothetical protein [Stylosanthes scabra]